MRTITRTRLAVALLLTTGCYSPRLAEHRIVTAPPAAIAAVFSQLAGGLLVLEADDPGHEYAFDPGEKDDAYAAHESHLRFRRVEVSLRERTPPGVVLADLTFIDGSGSRIEIRSVDLLRLIPRLDTIGELQYPELLLEEYERFGVSFRKEHGEFTIVLGSDASEAVRQAAARAYRLGIWNNCLDPGKWEMVLASEDYSDYAERRASPLNLNQTRTLAHVWFRMDASLYDALLRLKNPHLEVDASLDYEALSARAEEVEVDFGTVRTVDGSIRSRVVEFAHESQRKLVPIVREQHYKRELGLALSSNDILTYADVMSSDLRLAQFTDAGFYRPGQPKEFDLSWLGDLDEVHLRRLTVPGSQTYVEITVTGPFSPYSVVIGNVDLALLDEQRLYGLPFGFNPHPKTRRHALPQDTIHYQVDRVPDGIKPYVLLLDSETGQWRNNQKRGIEKVYVGWESIERDVLEVYLVSYERIQPLWMARVKVDDSVVDQARIRRQLFTY